MLPETRGKTLEDMEVLFGKFYKWRSASEMLKSKSCDNKDLGKQLNGQDNTNGQIQLGPTKNQAN
ncbi:hypothetical protein TIFTF001_006809 [Ficus carica]|uniref:Uncharacterized protein n=1 Tax=Ficus carica TaxID=3494 RepID=A0AA88A1D8_FICCA|nr:hypothetical protein TIFTF001_006809 [Ficus carica]